MSDPIEQALNGPTFTNPKSADEILAIGREEASSLQTQDLPAAANTNRWYLASAALAATLMFGVFTLQGPGGSEIRARGQLEGLPVRIEAVVDGVGRKLSSGDRVAADERVVFRVSSQMPGLMTIYEDGVAIADKRRVLAGENWLASEPVSFRPDGAASGKRTYVAEICPDDGPCSRTKMELRW